MKQHNKQMNWLEFNYQLENDIITNENIRNSIKEFFKEILTKRFDKNQIILCQLKKIGRAHV